MTERATLSIRLIKSFSYRNVKYMILHDLDLKNLNLAALVTIIETKIMNEAAYKPFSNVKFGMNFILFRLL